MSSITTRIESSYQRDIVVGIDKIFICTKCKKVTVKLEKVGWTCESPYSCLLYLGGCNSDGTMVEIKNYHGEKLEKWVVFSKTNGLICHPDLFSVNESGLVLNCVTIGNQRI